MFWLTVILFSLVIVQVVGFYWFEHQRVQIIKTASDSSVNGTATEFKVFKTIKLGTGIKDADGYRRAIEDKNMRIDESANDILGNPTFSVATKEIELDLVVVTPDELGLKNRDRFKLKDIYARAKEKGLQLCPNQVGPELRLRYTDQPKYEWLVIGMEPIVGLDGSLELFSVGRENDGLWLTTFNGFHGQWGGGTRFIFVLPRK